ncbi:dynein gamma flagellar outer, partial [Cystoisospora suis]
MQRLNSIIEQLKSEDCRLVFQALYSVSKMTSEVTPKSRQTVFHTLRRCKQIDISITEAFNEAKDNVKYLSTLENFMDPLYTGILYQRAAALPSLSRSIRSIRLLIAVSSSPHLYGLERKEENEREEKEAKGRKASFSRTPQTIIDNLGALMNAITMIHSISRYYNTTERMTNFFIKITNQMIVNCKRVILEDDHYDKLWEKEPAPLIEKLEICSRLNEAYHEHYRITKDKLLTMPKGKQFDFSEHQIFGRIDLFCRRILKLISL